MGGFRCTPEVESNQNACHIPELQTSQRETYDGFSYICNTAHSSATQAKGIEVVIKIGLDSLLATRFNDGR
jgi:hypothetical protein